MISKTAKSSAPVEVASLKQRLVDVAAEILTSPTVGKLPTMRQIAAAASVAPGAAYRHFESQNDLFFAVIAKLFADLEHKLREAAESATGKREKARRVALAYVQWGLVNPGGYQLLFETTDDDEMMKTGQRPGREILDTLAIWISAKGTASPKLLEKATQLWLVLHGLVSLRIHKTGMDWPNTLEADVDKLVALVVG